MALPPLSLRPSGATAYAGRSGLTASLRSGRGASETPTGASKEEERCSVNQGLGRHSGLSAAKNGPRTQHAARSRETMAMAAQTPRAYAPLDGTDEEQGPADAPLVPPAAGAGAGAGAPATAAANAADVGSSSSHTERALGDDDAGGLAKLRSIEARIRAARATIAASQKVSDERLASPLSAQSAGGDAEAAADPERAPLVDADDEESADGIGRGAMLGRGAHAELDEIGWNREEELEIQPPLLWRGGKAGLCTLLVGLALLLAIGAAKLAAAEARSHDAVPIAAAAALCAVCALGAAAALCKSRRLLRLVSLSLLALAAVEIGEPMLDPAAAIEPATAVSSGPLVRQFALRSLCNASAAEHGLADESSSGSDAAGSVCAAIVDWIFALSGLAPADLMLLLAFVAWRSLATPKELRQPCCFRFRLCLFELREWFTTTKVRGFALSEFLGLCGTVALPTLDAWLDWSIVIRWYMQGDVHWAQVGLTINLISGALVGVPLAIAGAGVGCDWVRTTPRSCDEMLGRLVSGSVLGLVGLLVGLSGLAPVAGAAFALSGCSRRLLGEQSNFDAAEQLKYLKYLKAAELIFEALPQSILQCVPSPSTEWYSCRARSECIVQDLRRRLLRPVQPIIPQVQLPAAGLRLRLVTQCRLDILRRGGDGTRNDRAPIARAPDDPAGRPPLRQINQSAGHHAGLALWHRGAAAPHGAGRGADLLDRAAGMCAQGRCLVGDAARRSCIRHHGGGGGNEGGGGDRVDVARGDPQRGTPGAGRRHRGGVLWRRAG
eukprot:COSAG04_NODE_254_length_18809_cov_8.025869_25_plen_780_part_00